MRKSVAGLGILVIVAGLGAGGYVVFGDRILGDGLTPPPVPQAVLDAEAALATDGTAALVHLDVGTATAIEDRLLGAPDRDALTPRLAGADELVEALLDAGIDMRSSIDHLVAAALPGEHGYGAAGVLTGRFAVEDIGAALRRHYDVEPVSIDGETVLILTRVDPDSCRPATPRALHVSEQRLVMASPQTIGALLARLRGRAAPAIDLGAWRSFRDGRVMSAAILVPASDLADGVNHPAVRMTNEATEPHLAPVGPVYAGVAFETFPTRFLLEARIEALEAGWAAATERDYAAWRDGLSADFAETMPALTRLAGHLEVAADGETLVGELAVGEELIADLGAVPGEALALMFRGSGVSFEQTTPTAGPREEKILPPEQVTAYRAEMSQADLRPFDPQLDVAFDDAMAVGPFVVRIDGFRLIGAGDAANAVHGVIVDDGDDAGNDGDDAAREEFVEVGIAALSGAVPNIASDSMHANKRQPRAGLTITEVRDAAGRDLLRGEDCGAQRNDATAALRSTTRHLFVDNEFNPVPVVEGEKKVRLKSGARVSDIAAIAGRFDLRLPTRVETVRVTAPFDGQVVERADVRIRLHDAAEQVPDEVGYEVSGAVDRVLAVRALNASGQYLRGYGGSASSRLLGAGKSVTKSFHGQPAEIEFVVAAQEETLEFPFELTDVAPHFDQWDRPEPQVVAAAPPGLLAAVESASDYDDICDGPLAFEDLGPFRLCMQELDAQWGGMTSRVQVIAPDVAALKGNLSVLELRLASVGRAGLDGAVAVDMATFLQLREVYGQAYLEDTPWLQTDAPEELDDDSEAPIAAVHGELVARVPTALEAFALPVTELGAAAEHANGLGVRLAGFENGGLRLTVTGPRDRIVQFVPRAGDGTALATNNVRIDPAEPPGTWSASMQVSGRPATLDIVVAATREETVYPFDLTLDRGSR